MMRSDLRVVLVTVSALAGLAANFASVAPAAAQATNFRQEFDDIKNAIPGLGADHAPIDFTERAPLVVPPTNDLPPPVDAPRALGVRDPDATARPEALSDPRRPVPAIDPGAAARGADARTFLIDPPSGMQNPDAFTQTGTPAAGEATPRHKRTAHVRHARRTPDVAAAQ